MMEKNQIMDNPDNPYMYIEKTCSLAKKIDCMQSELKLGASGLEDK